MKTVTLVRLKQNDKEQFIKDNQEAFNYGALEEFGRRDDHFEEDGEIISRETIEKSIDSGEAYRIMQDGKSVGGIVIRTDGERGSSHVHSQGIGYTAWCEMEKMHSEVTIWETVTPYFEKRNIHFYVNRCGYNINDKNVAFREFANLTFLKISVILSVNKEGVPLPLKVEH